MSEQVEKLKLTSIKSWEQGSELLDKLVDTARTEAVYGKPLTVEGQTVITAAEVSVGMGFGFGAGGGPSAEEEGGEGKAQFGSGGGGGGGAGSRPVAVIRISQEGVEVEPVVDITKIGLAFFTMLGSIFLMGGKMRRAAQGK